MRIILARHLFCKTRLIEVELAMQPKGYHITVKLLNKCGRNHQ